MEKTEENGRDWLLVAERFLKTDIRYLIRGGSWLGANQIVTTILAFLLSLAFANLLSPATYGLYKFVLSIAALLAIPTLSGIDVAVTQAVARNFDGTMLIGLKTKIRWGILTVLAGFLIGIYYYTQGNIALAIAFIVIGISVPLSEGFDIYNSFLIGKGLYNYFTYYNLATQLFLTIGLAITVFSSDNIIILIASYAALNVLLNLVFLILTLRQQRPNVQVDPQAMNYGKHLSVVSILGAISEQLDKILVFHYLGAVQLAVYTVAIAPTEQIKGALKNVQFLALSKFAIRGKEEVKKTIFHKAFYFGLFILLISLIYIVLAPFFFKLFFPKYIISVFYSQVLAVSIVGSSIATLFYTFLESHVAKKEIYQYNIFSNILNFIILFPLIYYFGLMGAVIARLIFRFSLLGISIVLVDRF
jgi:O-antigen/teichoic acid export membrane protein